MVRPLLQSCVARRGPVDHRSSPPKTDKGPLSEPPSPASLQSRIEALRAAGESMDAVLHDARRFVIGAARLRRHVLRTVLVVDDSADSRELGAAELRSFGFRVEEASDGAEAIERAIALRPDAIVMDFAMPTTDGGEAVRRLVADERTCHIPIVMLSAFTNRVPHDVRSCCAAFLAKPCEYDELGALIHVIADARHESADCHTGASEIDSSRAPGAPAVQRSDDASVHGLLPSILIVDDHRPNLIAIEAVLKPLGYPLVTVTSGEEALRHALAEDVAMIVMDVHMAGLDGYQTTALLRQRERLRDVPIVFLSAVYNQPEHTYQGYELGAVDYITKPFDPIVLRAKVGALVSLYLRGQKVERVRRQDAERTKDLFLGAVGHDLRNPLHAIVMASKLLGATPCPEELHRSHAARIERSARRMNRIIEDILDLTRGQFAGGIPLTLRPTDLGALCRSVVGELRTAHPARTFELEVTGEVSGFWDSDRLARVVSNLVGNAVQHCAEGSIRVAVTDQGERASLVVHNQGEPIPAADLPRLFEPFWGSESSSEGLGLGLYIVREIVRAHRGEVVVTSTEADGTSFVVTLGKRALSDVV